MYSLYFIDARVAPAQLPDPHQFKTNEFESMGQAIDAACGLMSRGATVWRIINTTGFLMERSDIEVECLRRRGLAR